MGVAEMWKASGWGGEHLLFLDRTCLSLCSITLSHEPPQVCSSASQHYSICPSWSGSPWSGDFVTDTSGWGGKGDET